MVTLPAQVNLDTKRFCHQVGTIMRKLETGTPWAQRAELYIGLFKGSVTKDQKQADSPMVLWDYCMERRSLIHNVVPRPLFQANGLSPHEITFGSQADISNICRYAWYDWVYYKNPASFPESKWKLGRVLGPMKNEGNEMAQAILTSQATVVPRRTVRALSRAELISEIEKRKRATFDAIIKAKMGDSITKPVKSQPTDFVPYSDGNLDPITVEELEEDPVGADGLSVFEKPVTDQLIFAELTLPLGDNMHRAKVIGRSTNNDDGSTVGTYDHNPMLNSMVYDVEFSNGIVKEYAANVIAENIYSQVDPEGYSTTILDLIMDYKRDGNATDKADKYIFTKSGTK